MGTQPLLPGRGYWLKTAAGTVGASITEIRHKVDVNTQAALSATQLALNEVGSCNLELDRAIAFERYADNRKLGGFILIDRQTHATVACGTIDRKSAVEGKRGSVRVELGGRRTIQK